jgi:hypothetical protein
LISLLEIMMSRISKTERIKLWLERLDRQRSSGESIARFCADEGISAPSFYQWKRRLTPSIASAGKAQTTRRPNSKPTGSAKTALSKPAFSEVQIVEQRSPAIVLLPCGISIQLGCDLQIAGSIVDRVLRHSLGSTESES